MLPFSLVLLPPTPAFVLETEEHECWVWCDKVSAATGGNKIEAWKEEIYCTLQSRREGHHIASRAAGEIPGFAQVVEDRNEGETLSQSFYWSFHSVKSKRFRIG